MECNAKLPSNLVFNGDKNKNFSRFIQAFEIYLEAAALTEATDTRKIALLLNAAGEEALEVFNTFTIDSEEKKQYASVVNEFQKYCSQRESETMNRFMFFKRVKEEHETFDNFFADLKLLAQKCNFGDQLELLIRDKIVSGVQDPQLQETLLTINELSLEKAEKTCRAAEAVTKQVEVIQESTPNSVKKIKSEVENLSDTSDDEEVVIDELNINCKDELDIKINELSWHEKMDDTDVNLSNVHDDSEIIPSDSLFTSSGCNMEESTLLSDSSRETFCVSNTNILLSDISKQNSNLCKVTSVEPTENSLHDFLKSCNEGIELLQTYKQTGIVKRRKLVDLIINQELKNDLNLRISKDRFQFLSESICNIFPTECKSTYFIPAYRNKEGKPISAHGKLWGKYVNQRVKYQKLKLIPKRKK